MSEKKEGKLIKKENEKKRSLTDGYAKREGSGS